mgnify:CR=1 FL=1
MSHEIPLRLEFVSDKQFLKCYMVQRMGLPRERRALLGMVHRIGEDVDSLLDQFQSCMHMLMLHIVKESMGVDVTALRLDHAPDEADTLAEHIARHKKNQ